MNSEQTASLLFLVSRLHTISIIAAHFWPILWHLLERIQFWCYHLETFEFIPFHLFQKLERPCPENKMVPFELGRLKEWILVNQRSYLSSTVHNIDCARRRDIMISFLFQFGLVLSLDAVFRDTSISKSEQHLIFSGLKSKDHCL